jgi:hypothetical protein
MPRTYPPPYAAPNKSAVTIKAANSSTTFLP